MNKSLFTNIVALSFIFIGYSSPLYSHELKTMGLYSFSGAITNWLAIHMLFEKVPFLYGSGIITERFEDFKRGIEELIMNQFFTQENLNRFLSPSKELDKDKIINSFDYDLIFNKLKEAILESPFGGMLGMFGGEQALEPLKPQFQEKFKEIISETIDNKEFISNFSGAALGDEFLDKTKHIVSERLDEMTPKMVKEHLGWLVVWGGVFGALIGLLTTL